MKTEVLIAELGIETITLYLVQMPLPFGKYIQGVPEIMSYNRQAVTFQKLESDSFLYDSNLV